MARRSRIGRAGPMTPRMVRLPRPNSRFTVGCQAESQPTRSIADAPGGVPISAIVFGGRRRTLAPLGVSSAELGTRRPGGCKRVASETTAAATSEVGVLRRDPMAMKPFAGYNFADYWAHWIDVGAKLKSPPADLSRQLVSPGPGRQILVARLWRQSPRVALDHRSLQGLRLSARDTAIGAPAGRLRDLDTQGLDMAPGALDELLDVNPSLCQAELQGIGAYLDEFGERIPRRDARRISHRFRSIG